MFTPKRILYLVIAGGLLAVGAVGAVKFFVPQLGVPEVVFEQERDLSSAIVERVQVKGTDFPIDVADIEVIVDTKTVASTSTLGIKIGETDMRLRRRVQPRLTIKLTEISDASVVDHTPVEGGKLIVTLPEPQVTEINFPVNSVVEKEVRNRLNMWGVGEDLMVEMMEQSNKDAARLAAKRLCNEKESKLKEAIKPGQPGGLEFELKKFFADLYTELDSSSNIGPEDIEIIFEPGSLFIIPLDVLGGYSCDR